jgi:serine/threonine protein kinase
MMKLEDMKEALPITAMREIKLLKQLNHKNIVNLVEIVTSNPSSLALQSSESGHKRSHLYLVFEYAEHDL